MGYSHFDAATRHRPAWNAGKNVGTKRPLTQKQIWAIRFHLDREGRLRDKALFDLAIDSKLRGCDLVKIKIGDVVAGVEVRNRATVIQQKTNRPVQFELTADVRAVPANGPPLIVQHRTGPPQHGNSIPPLPTAECANPSKVPSMPASFTSTDSESEIAPEGNPRPIPNGRKPLYRLAHSRARKAKIRP